ncbi:Pleckstrin homology domain-containing family G member 6 [Oryzias melastigma]|uniref:Pleckstrin homology domain-containing family G member 6 n=1 Tax=Oryzias melastigma TaxID=30732 RepID=A0A834FJ89_ORYME|nr:Pleckstrin homology domain-containing family G member 6 [Oryzias melastigma]
MDPTKHSYSSKVLYANRGGGTDSPTEEMVQSFDSVNGEMQADAESREPDVLDGKTAADTTLYHKGSAEKNKSNTFKNQRKTKQKVVSDFGTASRGTSSGTKARTSLQGLFSPAGPDKTTESQLDALRQELEAYTVPVSLKWMWREESNGATLEKSWTDLVQNHSTMSKMQRHQQEALWELISTELIYINKLKIIKDLVIAALLHLHQRGFLQEVSPDQLFYNLPSILQAHQLFWQEVVYPMVQEVRQTGKPFDPMGLEEGCRQFQKRFLVYREYCWEEENSLDFTRRQMESNPHFQTFIQWVENHAQGERMRLGDMQAKPHQRITKYPLLLKAVLKHTEEPRVQQALRDTLSSVNVFLESINDYMQKKDDELALYTSARRVEGYEVEGINEEIDKCVQEICKFNLECPIRGVSPEVVRKLLLEENLKVRVRKDQKLEVVALLFSDVILLTKIQKRGEGLKVVRPPLALDRIECIALKDGCSFLLVEVGELQSVMNVLIFVASTSLNCSKWVSTINEAKEMLKNLRELETNRLEGLRVQQVEAKNVAKSEDIEIKVPPNSTTNGSHKAELELPSEEAWTNSFGQLLQNSLQLNQIRKSGRRSIGGGQPNHKEQDVSCRNPQKEENKMTEPEKATTGMWNQREESAPNSDQFTRRKPGHSVRNSSLRRYTRVIDELPDVDYPTEEESTLQLNYNQQFQKWGSFRSDLERKILERKDSNSRLAVQDGNRNSSQSEGLSIDPGWSSKQLKSPELRKRRSLNSIPPLPQQTSTQVSGQNPAVSNSSSDSESGQNFKRNSLPASFGSDRSDPHRVIKPSALKSNQDQFVNKARPDLQTPSETEDLQNKKPKPKPQRRSSNPNIPTQENLRANSNKFYATSPPQRPPPSKTNSEVPALEGLLERAKERDKSGIKRDRNLKPVFWSARYYPPSYPMSPISPKPPMIPTKKDPEPECKEVELTRRRAMAVSQGWREQLVDGDEDCKDGNLVFLDGENVDWTGWCLDDD